MIHRGFGARRASAVLVIAAIVTAAVWAASAGAAKSAAPTHVTIATAGGGKFKANGFYTQTLHFAQANVTIKSGGTLTLAHGSSDKFPDPHTLTIVNKGELPHTALQIDQCGPTPPSLCALGNGNFPSMANPNGTPFFNVGAAGLNQRGDSLAIQGTSGAKSSIQVTAAAGTTLYYFCVIHAWMQGVIHVK